MPCPEQRAWGGVTKPQMLRAYGLIDTRLYRFRAVMFGLFLANTRLRYRLLARHIAREIEQYRDAGVAVGGVVGIGASPSCGVHTTLDMRRSFETIAACPLAAIDRAMINERVVTASRVAGEGLFIRALRKQLRRRKIEIPFLEHDLIVEMQGREQPLDVRTGSGQAARAQASGARESNRSRWLRPAAQVCSRSTDADRSHELRSASAAWTRCPTTRARADLNDRHGPT